MAGRAMSDEAAPDPKGDGGRGDLAVNSAQPKTLILRIPKNRRVK
jgi:hypothetical protein